MSGISKLVDRHISQSVCPWNWKVLQALADDSPLRARDFIAGKDTKTLAQDILVLDQAAFTAAFRKSPMKRAKLRGLKRNAAVVLGNVGTSDDIPHLKAALDHDDLTLREHNAWAHGALSARAHRFVLSRNSVSQCSAMTTDVTLPAAPERVRAMMNRPSRATSQGV